MTVFIASLVLALLPAAAGGEHFACDMSALTRAERASHEQVSRRLMTAVLELREVEHGYAFRLPSNLLVTTAEWASLERRCCPFFGFEIDLGGRGGPLWLRVTGPQGIKPFIRAEFGLDAAR